LNEIFSKNIIVAILIDIMIKSIKEVNLSKKTKMMTSLSLSFIWLLADFIIIIMNSPYKRARETRGLIKNLIKEEILEIQYYYFFFFLLKLKSQTR
jgi:hypothetical protein